MRSADITTLLQAWRDGDRAAESSLLTEIYPVLREIARKQLRRISARVTLQATELAHEAYERLHRQQPEVWQSRAHFFAMTATVIRNLLIDRLRRRASEKHGGDTVMLSLEPELATELVQPETDLDWLALDQALSQLEELDPDSARVVEMRMFTGLSIQEVADVLGVSRATVGRHWRFARVFLADRFNP